MAELNDLLVRGDTLLQGNTKVEGTLNGTQTITDNDTLIIDICKTIDMSTTGVKLSVEIPSGYVADPTYDGSPAFMCVDTYPTTNGNSWTTTPTLKITYTNAQTNSATSISKNISNVSATTVQLVPFISGTLSIEVTNAGSDTQVKGVVLSRLICRKQ